MTAIMPWNKPSERLEKRGSKTAMADLNRHTKAVQALQSLLQNSINFVPATQKTKDDEARMAKNAQAPPVLRPRPSQEADEAEDDHITTQQTISDQWQSQSSAQLRSRGLPNPHVMCYRNSTLQALLHQAKFCNWLEAHPSPCAEKQPCTACALKRFAQQYWQQVGDVVQQVTKLTGTLRGTEAFAKWRWSEQQDSNEFYLNLVNAIVERNPRSARSMHGLFGHRIARTTFCGACHHPSRVVSPFEYRIGVAIEAGSCLGEILRHNTFATAMVSGYQCEKCKRRVRAKQTSCLTSLPDILQLDLLRFKQVGHGRYAKNSKMVRFDLNLDLSPFCETRDIEATYRLQAVVQHVGSFSMGHYRCIARSPNGPWVDLDDTSVRKVKADNAFNPGGGWTPYTLFYAKTGSNASSAEATVEDSSRLSYQSPQTPLEIADMKAGRKRKRSINDKQLLRHRMKS